MTRNVITCLTCGEVVESTFRHDYRTCGCPEETVVIVDGGHDYFRRGWGSKARWVEGDTGEGREEPTTAPQQPRPLFGEDLDD